MDKAQVKLLIEGLKSEEQKLQAELAELESEERRIQVQMTCKQGRLDLVVGLQETLAHYHDDTVPEPIPL